MVGLTAGAAQGAITNLVARKKKGRLSVTTLAVSNNALGYGAFLGIYANLRYQLLCGFDRAMVTQFDVIGVGLAFSTALRIMNAQLGETTVANDTSGLGITRSIEGNFTASKPQTLEEAITITQRLMDQDLLQVVVLFTLALMDFHELVLAGDLLSIGGVSRCLELSVGEEDMVTLDVPALQNSSYKGPNRRSNSCCDETVVSAEGRTCCILGTGKTQKDTELPQTSVPLNLGADEAVHKEGSDSVERAITTDAILGIDTGGSPRRQETMRGTPVRLALITLTKRVKKLETQLKQKKSKAVIHSSDEEAPSLDIKDSPKQGRMIGEIDKDETIYLVSEQGEVQETTKPLKDDDDATFAKTLLNIKRSTAKDKGKGIMQETKLSKKLKKREMIQLSLDEELAQKLHAKELAKETERQEHDRYNLKKALELQK
nr:protein reticulata-related 1, chloroplastic-like [Tanacetum cinerariifolium]